MSENKTYNHIAGKRAHRIEAISDGVFAVAFTLLVLDIKVPISDTILTEKDLFAAICNLTPRFLSYFLSFMTLGIFWTGHNAQYTFIDKSDRNLNWLALFFLMFVSLLPFTTAFLSEHITFKVAIGLYWLNILALGLLILIHWGYAYKHNLLSIDGEEKEMVNKLFRRRVIIAQSLYAAGAALCFVNIYLSIASIILVQLNYAFAPFSGVGKK